MDVVAPEPVFRGPDGIKIHTPDPRRYFRTGDRSTQLPTADRNGRSLAFDPTKPGPVFVMEKGSPALPVDVPAVVGSGLERSASAVSSAARDPTEAYHGLARLVGAPAPVHTQNLAQEVPLPDAPSGAPEPALPVAAAPVPYAPAAAPPQAAYQPQPAYAPQPRASYPPGFVPSNLAQPDVSAQLEELRQLMSRMTPPPPAPVVGRPWDAPKPAEPAGLTLDSLGLGFLGLEEPRRPRVPVYVDLGPAGKLEFQYHAVSACDAAVLLAYDTRYEGGMRWEPPVNAEQSFKVTAKTADVRAYCRHFGIRVLLGVLDVIVLIKDRDEEG